VKIVPGQVLTSREVGDLLQANASSVKKWIDDGHLSAHRTPGGHRRIRASDLVHFMDAHAIPIPDELQGAGRRRLLVVDDDPGQLRAIARSLKRYEDAIDVVATSNGIDALVLVGSFRPHVVLLDVYMPGLDGLEVCRRLTKRPETHNIQVILVSGGFTAVLEKKALEAGAARCLKKPLTPKVILDCLRPPTREVFVRAG
jgi:excisionase family DNA binding protein